MKKLILAILVLCASIGAKTEPAKASGAIVVFLELGAHQFKITSAIRDKIFNNSPLYNVLESANNNIYVMRVHPDVYRWATYYFRAYNYDVAFNMNANEKIKFHYYSSVKAFIGRNSKDETVVLLPDNLQRPYPSDEASIEDELDLNLDADDAL